jgi:hypothetical protein
MISINSLRPPLDTLFYQTNFAAIRTSSGSDEWTSEFAYKPLGPLASEVIYRGIGGRPMISWQKMCFAGCIISLDYEVKNITCFGVFSV